MDNSETRGRKFDKEKKTIIRRNEDRSFIVFPEFFVF